MACVGDRRQIPFVPDSELAELISTLPATPIGDPPYPHPAFRYTFPWPELGSLASNQGGMPRAGWELGGDSDHAREALRRLLAQDGEPFDAIPGGRQSLQLVVKEVSAIWERQDFLPGYVEQNDVLLIEALVSLRRGRLGLPLDDSAVESPLEDISGSVPRRLASETPHVVELGAGGTGLPGIAVARLWRHGSTVVFAERELAAWDSLRENLKLNGFGEGSCSDDSERSRCGSDVPSDDESPHITRDAGNCDFCEEGHETSAFSFAALHFGDAALAKGSGPDLALCSHMSRLGTNAQEACATLAAFLQGDADRGEGLALVAHAKRDDEGPQLFGIMASMGLTINLVLEEYSSGGAVYAVRRMSNVKHCRPSWLIRREEESGDEWAFWLESNVEVYSPITDTVCAARPSVSKQIIGI